MDDDDLLAYAGVVSNELIKLLLLVVEFPLQAQTECFFAPLVVQC